MPDLEGSKTHDNLKEAFAGESQANRRYLYFAQKADVEGYPDVAALFRSVAEGETGHAFGHFDFLAEVVHAAIDAGAHIFVRRHQSFDITGRVFHLSNAYLGPSNPGIPVGLQFAVGYTWY